MRRVSLHVLVLAAAAMLFSFALSCESGSSGGGSSVAEDDDDDDPSDEDRAAVFCDMIEACGFADDLAIDECVSYADEMSEWLLNCAVRSKGCRDLAECFNLPEGV
ncbi:hypothetical protein K8I61_16040 [bacterium]|nr:hypothetical protein [bacterium]